MRTLLILFITTFCFGDVTWKVLKVDKDTNGNIQVKTQFKIDGVEVQSRYPTLNGKYYFVTRFSAQNFWEMTAQEKKDFITAELDKHAQALIAREYMKKENDLIITKDLVGLTSTVGTKTEAKVKADTDGNGLNDKEYTVKTDGTKTSKTIIESGPII